jgi:hypothetical protein
VTFVPESTVATDMMDGWHGYIEFADFSVIYDQDGTMFFNNTDVFGEDKDGDQSVTTAGVDEFADYYDTPVIYVTEPTVMAKITNGTIFVKIYNDPGFTGVDLVAPIEDDTDISDPGDASWGGAEDEEAENDVDVNLSEGGGITVGYDSDMIDVEVYVADNDGYGGAGDESNDWIVGGMVTIAASGAEITAEVNKAWNVDNDALAVAAKAAYTLDAGMMTVAPYVAIDGYDDTATTDFLYEFGGGLDLTFTNDNTAGVHVFYSGQTDLGPLAVFGDGDDMIKGFDVEVSVTEDGEAGFVPGLGVDILFGYYDAGTDQAGDEADMLASVDVDYMFGDFQPYVKFDLDMTNSTTMYRVDVGVNWTGIPNTTITAEWDSGDLNASPDPLLGSIELVAKVEM